MGKKAVSIGLMFLLSGCVPGGFFMHDPSGLSPEQLEKYKALGYDAIRCVTVKGPPPGGTVTSVTIPKNRKAVVKFVGCDVQTVDVGNVDERPTETMAPQPKPTIQ